MGCLLVQLFLDRLGFALTVAPLLVLTLALSRLLTQVLSADAYAEPPGRFEPGVEGEAGWRTRSVLAVPLVHEGVVLGVVQLQGAWNQQARRRDGLPWWGWVAAPGTNERADGLESLAQRIVGRMPA